MGRTIRVSRDADWDVEGDVVRLRIAKEALSQDFQKPLAASPTYAWCLAYWLGRLTGRPWRARIEVVGPEPSSPEDQRHWNRSGALLRAYEAALGDRFCVDSEFSLPKFPANAEINAESGPRVATEGASGEHALEVALTQPGPLSSWLSDVVGGVQDGFHRQRPVGVFAGAVAQSHRWAPGGASQIDLWARAAVDGRFHLIELKDHGNAPLGIIPEALYYQQVLRLGGEAQVSVWLVAPKFHPLVWFEGSSPLEWLNEGLAESGTEFRVQHLPEELWPSQRYTLKRKCMMSPSLGQ